MRKSICEYFYALRCPVYWCLWSKTRDCVSCQICTAISRKLQSFGIYLKQVWQECILRLYTAIFQIHLLVIFVLFSKFFKFSTNKNMLSVIKSFNSFFQIIWLLFFSSLTVLPGSASYTNGPLGPSVLASASVLQSQQSWVQSCLCFCLLWDPGNLGVFFSVGGHNTLRAEQVLSHSLDTEFPSTVWSIRRKTRDGGRGSLPGS